MFVKKIHVNSNYIAMIITVKIMHSVLTTVFMISNI